MFHLIHRGLRSMAFRVCDFQTVAKNKYTEYTIQRVLESVAFVHSPVHIMRRWLYCHI